MVELEIKHVIPPVEHDPNQINQVLLNLLLNAIQSMDKPGTVRVSLEVDELNESQLSPSPTRDGHHSRTPRQYLSPLLHDQRPWHWPGSLACPAHRRSAWRQHRGNQRSREGNALRGPAAGETKRLRKKLLSTASTQQLLLPAKNSAQFLQRLHDLRRPLRDFVVAQRALLATGTRHGAGLNTVPLRAGFARVGLLAAIDFSAATKFCISVDAQRRDRRVNSLEA